MNITLEDLEEIEKDIITLEDLDILEGDFVTVEDLETVETHLQEKIKKNIDPIKNKIITLKKELEDQQEELQEKIQEISKNISELEDNLNSIEKTETVIKVDDEKPEITPEEVIKLINQAKGTIDGDRVGGGKGRHGILGSPLASNGVPNGGTQGQVLAKRNGIDYDLEWIDGFTPTTDRTILATQRTAEPVTYDVQLTYEVLEYTYGTTKYYRRVYNTYSPSTDAFYTDDTLTTEICNRALSI